MFGMMTSDSTGASIGASAIAATFAKPLALNERPRHPRPARNEPSRGCQFAGRLGPLAALLHEWTVCGPAHRPEAPGIADPGQDHAAQLGAVPAGADSLTLCGTTCPRSQRHSTISPASITLESSEAPQDSRSLPSGSG